MPELRRSAPVPDSSPGPLSEKAMTEPFSLPSSRPTLAPTGRTVSHVAMAASRVSGLEGIRFVS